MTLKLKRWDREDKAKRSTAQDAATQRNFAIFKIRGLWVLAGILAEPFRTTARDAIDADLVARGAKPQAQHEAERWAKEDAEFEASIPF